MLKIRSWSNHRLVGPIPVKRNSTRRTTKITRTAEPMLRDVIELKQAALWHGGKIRVDQACEAAADGMARQPKESRISFRSEGIISSSVIHQERATSSQTSHPPSCASSSSAVELPRMSGRDLKEPVAPVERSHEERETFWWRRFLLTYLVVTASTAQLCQRKLREAQEARNRLCSADQEQQVVWRKEIPQPETLANSDTSDHRSSSGAILTTTNGRLGNEDFGLSALRRTESVSRERIPGMDDVSVMWSPLESKDGPGRHSGEDGTDNRTNSIDTPLPRMCLDDATTTDDKQNGDVLRMQPVSLVQKSGTHISCFGTTCFTVCALVFGRFSRIGRELQNVECTSRTSRITTGTTIPTGTATASFVFWHHGSGSTTGDHSNVSRPTAEDQGKQGSSDLARHNAQDLNNTGVLHSVRV